MVCSFTSFVINDIYRLNENDVLHVSSISYWLVYAHSCKRENTQTPILNDIWFPALGIYVQMAVLSPSNHDFSDIHHDEYIAQKSLTQVDIHFCLGLLKFLAYLQNDH
jgi:hypothetical protein